MSASDYILLEQIGTGASSQVWTAQNKLTEEIVAVKILDMDDTNIEYLQKEVQVLAIQKHPNVIQYYKSLVSEEDHKLWIVMELMDSGNCCDLLKTKYHKGMPEVLIATILKELLTGLAYVHDYGIIHRDIKGSNVLLTKEGDVKICDFGVSGMLNRREDRKKTLVGTPAWMAPEVMDSSVDGYGKSADIWSFGITALEMAYGKAPYETYSPMKVIMMSLQCPPPELERGGNTYKYSKSFQDMIKLCLKKNPEERSAAKTLLKHKFFKQAKDSAYIKTHLPESSDIIKL